MAVMTRRLTRFMYLELAVLAPALRSTMRTLSFDLIQPSSVTVRRASARSSVIFSAAKASGPAKEAVAVGMRMGLRLRWNWSWRATCSSVQRATTGTLGRILARERATSPVEVMAMINFAPRAAAVSTAAEVMASREGSQRVFLPSRRVLTRGLGAPKASSRSASTMESASRAMDCMALTAARGYLPAAVSPESMTASVPSMTAWPTSVTSARVGRGFFCMESSIWVATMTGFPASLQARTMSFWCLKTCSKGISTPRSPRAIMMPSEASRMSSKFATPSWLSIFETTIGRVERPASPQHRSRCAMTARTSAALRMKDAATASTPASTPHRRSARSFSVSAGSCNVAPGKFTPLFFFMGPAFKAVVLTKPVARSTETTSKAMRPSSRRTCDPSLTVDANWS
mmetsp:Transcript_27380/g.88435  ORF Transcript_27380/g.88435 Transcript_27380/m.88435 type:complete len:401 (+) Transcript_27380:185-1387(+)